MEERLKGIDELGNVEEISNLKVKIESEKEKIKELKFNIEKLENEINDKKAKVTEITKEISNVRDQERSKIRVLGGIEKELRDRKDKIREINSLVECPTCLQEIGDAHKSSVSKRLENEIIEIEKELKNVNVELENIRAEIKSREDEIWSIENEVKELSIGLNDLIKMRFSVENEIESISYQIQNLENNKKMRDWVSAEIEKLKDQENKVVSDLNILEEEVLAENWWIERLTRYKAEIMDRVIDKFSQVVNEFLYRLTNRFSVKMNYKVSGTKRIGEKLILTILDRGQEIEWKRLSNGERRLVALALNLCFNYVSSKILASDWNLLIFDEVFDGLDNVVREKVVDLMLDLVNDMQKSIIIVSHEDISYKEESLEKLRLGV
jgi:DNA repair exonuclease SbcCD ATPase subunit